VGDRYGRKAALVWSNPVFGLFKLAAAYSTDLTQMFWLRLLVRHLLIGPQHYQFSSRVTFATFSYVRG
jgi:MFS family permease